MSNKPVRRYQLCIERVETLEDVKKILNTLQLRIDTDNPLYEELEYYFSVEVVPPGYLKLIEKVGQEALAEMTMEEIEIEAAKLLNETDNDSI